MTEEQARQLIEEYLSRFIKTGKFVFDKQIQILDGRKIQAGKSVGTSLGMADDQKVGFHNCAVIRANHIDNPTGGGSGLTDAIDASARIAINAILVVLENKGILKLS
jgi:hypothetical protein